MRLLLWWFFMLIAYCGYAQTLHIVDKETGKPLEFVSVSGYNPPLTAYTDAEGNADITAFQNNDSIFIQNIAYKMQQYSYLELQEKDFLVALIRDEVILNELTVSSYKVDTLRKTSIHIEPLFINEIERRGSFNLTDALSVVPGVTSLSTGIGISKPVIRGLYGNRILILFSGLRFDSQQWQDEHGLGLSDAGISKIEIIKGPLSILYGTETIGGVINIVEEQAPPIGSTVSDVITSFHSNTLGGSIQVGTKSNYGNKWYRLRIGLSANSDYSDGNNVRVLNSRFNAYFLKGSYGFIKNKWKSDNHLHFSVDQFGFILSDAIPFENADERWSKQMAGPYQRVMLSMFSSINTIDLSNSKLSINAGIQSNFRSENEGAGELSLVMHLITTQYALKWNKELTSKLTLVLANNSSMENNINYGKRKLVPDAFMFESALSAYLQQDLHKVVVEYGIGGGWRSIKTKLTKTVNSDEKDIDPFQQTRPFFNAMLGMSYMPDEHWNAKFNLSSGVRAPNLAELSSNGLHEGVYTYELGSPELTNEQNINGELGFYYSGKNLLFSLSGFYNYFGAYIYLEPTAQEWYGFPVYEYRQHEAAIYGNETTLSYTIPEMEYLTFSASYAMLVGKMSNGEYLPYMPAQKFCPEIAYDRALNSRLFISAFVNADLVLEQKLINSQEITSPSYQLLNMGISMTLTSAKANYRLNIAANNLLNEAYYDHLSRFKNFGLLNIGRDISINLKINFIQNLKKQHNENFK